MGIDIVEVHRRLWQFRIDELREYVKRSESALVEEVSRFKQLRDDDDAFVDEYDVVHNILPRYVRYAQVLMIFGIYEYSVGEICRLVERARLQKLRQRASLDEMRDYLLAVGVNASAFGDAWVYLDRVREVRNRIAHENGVVKEGHPLIRILEPEPLLGHDLRDYGIIVHAGFAGQMIDRVDQAITDIHECAANLIRQAHLGRRRGG